MKPILYISGPYSAETLIDRQQNILDAKRRFIAALATGEWWAVCPHTHTDGIETHLPQIPHEEWLKMDITMLAGCDALWVDSDNELSDGVMLETAWAIESGMPVYYTPYIAKPGFMEDNGCDIGNRLLLFAKNNIFQMVSRGEIPDPKTYKGSALNARKPCADIIDADGVQYTRIAGMQRPASEIVDADTEQVTAGETRVRPQSDIIVAREK